ncbi:MAG TPA: prolyl oligopeptidase family serine peptidase [Pyrinomonadaceae bacterium]|nr:prolyl oligopeptidase family serine peptidase [Pyrinomonadaceae bacterium]
MEIKEKLIFFLLLSFLCVKFGPSAQAQNLPETPKRIVKENFFGREIEDPYRWLENVKDAEVLRWLGDQNAYTRSVLDRIPKRDQILARLRQLDSDAPPPLSSFSRDDQGLFYFYRTDSKGISRGYVYDPKTRAERILIDPETLGTPGQPARVSAISPSPDGKYVAFLMRSVGRSKVLIMDAVTGELVGQPVENALGFTGLDWDPDSRSIYLVKLPSIRPNMKPAEAFLNSASYRHVVGADPATDQPIIVQGENRGLVLKSTSWPFVFPTPDGKFLAVWVEDGARTGHALYVAPRIETIGGKSTWKKVADFEDGATGIAFHDSEAFVTVPRNGGSGSQIVRINVATEAIATGKVLQLPAKETTIKDVQAGKDALYVAANEGTAGVLYRIGYDGMSETIKPPIEGSIRLLMVSPAHAGGLLGVTAWTRPAAMYDFDPKRGWTESNMQSVSRLGTLPDLEVESLKVRSHDGVEVPLTLIYRRGLKRDSLNPTYMLGYGSYAATSDPRFDTLYIPWYEAGGVLAFAHVRGGGELGEAWHQAGSKDKKPNTWLDFIACAQYLIDRKYTSSARLAGGGVSAGGILIGRSITEKPDLFAAATISVATTDMLRAEYQMNGPANVVEFGTTKEKRGFEQLYEMSAYHHVREGVRYPAVLISTGMRDTNVDVWQPAKMAARMQAASNGGRPVLLRIDPNAGHDEYGSTRPQMQELRADQLTFLLWHLGILKVAAKPNN